MKVESFACTMQTRTELLVSVWFQISTDHNFNQKLNVVFIIQKVQQIDGHKSWNSSLNHYNLHVVTFLFGPSIEQLHVVFSRCNQKEGLGPSQDCIKHRCWTEVRVPSCLTTIVEDQQVVWSCFWERFVWLTGQLIHKVVHWRPFYYLWNAVDGLKRHKVNISWRSCFKTMRIKWIKSSKFNL